MADKAILFNQLGKIPLIGTGLRWFARCYPEGSVVKIKSGQLSGYLWKRYHRHVSGYWFGTYEIPVQECLVRILKPGNIFYDIGANAGFFSLLGSKCVGDKGHVYSFEPLPDNIDAIKSQLEINNVTNTTLIEAAVSDSDGKIEFCEGSHASTAHIKQPDDKGMSTIVKTITLDEFIRRERLPDLIKMDIEGAEILALKGAQNLLSGQNSPKLLIELHGQDIARKVKEIFQRENYNFYTLDMKRIESSVLPHHVLAFPRTTPE